MTVEELAIFIENSNKHKSKYIQIVLYTNNQLLVYTFKDIKLYRMNSCLSDWEQKINNHLSSWVLSFGKFLYTKLDNFDYWLEIFHDEYATFIPTQQISGINMIEVGTMQNFDNTMNDEINKVFFSAIQFKFPYEIAISLMRIGGFTQPVAFSDKIVFSKDTPLYTDWNYLSLISGGINNIGIGIPFASLSAGWDKSLWSLFKEKVIKMPKDKSKSEKILTGYVSIIKINKEYPLLFSEYEESVLEMEGVKWIGAIITDNEYANIGQLNNDNWEIVFFREDGFMFPKHLWDNIYSRVTVYGEIISIEINTQIGIRNSFLKARCAAYIK